MATSDINRNFTYEHYRPFGEKVVNPTGTNNDQWYTAKQFDADIGLSYMQARYYDPVIGRFMSNDPVGFVGNPHTFNRYAYVGNNPYKYTDPTGMAMECVTDDSGNESCTVTPDSEGNDQDNNIDWGTYVIAGDLILGGPTGEGIIPAMAMLGVKQAIKTGIKLTIGGKRKIGNLIRPQELV